MAAMTYHVTARPWEHGWELDIHDVGITQSHTLADADRMVRDYLQLDGHPDSDVSFEFDLAGLEAEVDTARHLSDQAARDQVAAAAAWRTAAHRLRAAGLSVSDTAVVLGVSKARVSQLAS